MEFGSLFEFIRNGMSVKQDKSGDGLPISRIETIADATVNPEKVGFAGLKLEDCKNWLLRPGDILFSHINSVDHVGKCAVYRGLPEQLVHGMNLLCFRCDPKVAVPEFVKYLIRGPVFRANLSNFINKAVNQASVSIGNLKTISVRVPSISEQRRIAAILDQADALRAKRREALAQLDSLTQSIFIEMFGDPVTNSLGWPTKRLKDVAEFENGDRSSNYPSGDDILDSGVLFLSTKNIIQSRLDVTEAVFISQAKFKSLSRGKARKGDLIVTLRGTLGNCCIFDCEHETAFINAQMMLIRPGEGCSTHYLHALLTSKQAKDRFLRIGNGAAVPQLTSKQFAELDIPIPPKSLQTQFAERLQTIRRMESMQHSALTSTEALFISLQHRAFQGEL